MNASILIATYGSNEWKNLAFARALPSVRDSSCEILVGHESKGTVSSARNGLAERATGDWLIFLDADDELGSDYIGAMTRSLEQQSFPAHLLLLVPARSYVIRGRRTLTHFEEERPLSEGNWLPIGTAVSTSLFFQVGGFREWPLYEDWDLWLRCSLAGAEILRVPEAVYLAHVRKGSRNRSHSQAERHYWHQQIGHSVLPDLYDAA